MTLSRLTNYTQAQYNGLGITPFSTTPGSTSSGNPDSRVSVQLDGWVGTDELAFRVVDQPEINVHVNVSNANSNILSVTVNRGPDPNTVTTYWTVNLGPGASGTDWTITYNVSDGTTSTGTWIFTKGKSPEPFKG